MKHFKVFAGRCLIKKYIVWPVTAGCVWSVKHSSTIENQTHHIFLWEKLKAFKLGLSWGKCSKVFKTTKTYFPWKSSLSFLQKTPTHCSDTAIPTMPMLTLLAVAWLSAASSYVFVYLLIFFQIFLTLKFSSAPARPTAVFALLKRTESVAKKKKVSSSLDWSSTIWRESSAPRGLITPPPTTNK